MPEDPMEIAAERYADRFGRYNLIAVVENLDRAREVLNALQRRGIEATNLSLLGPAAERAQEARDPTDRDGAVIADVTKATAAGSVAGGAAGGVAGFLAGLAAFAIPGVGPVVGSGIWISTLGGAVIGSGVGGVLSGVSSLNASEAWELTHEVEGGRALVGVHSEDRDVIERARSALDGEKVLALGEFDEHGRKVE